MLAVTLPTGQERRAIRPRPATSPPRCCRSASGFSGQSTRRHSPFWSTWPIGQGRRVIRWRARDQFAAVLPADERALGPEHPDTLITRGNLAYWTGRAGDPAGARDQFAALRPVRERVLGPEHPDTLATRDDLASWTGQAGDPAGASDQYSVLLSVYQRMLGPDHPKTLATWAYHNYWAGDADSGADPA